MFGDSASYAAVVLSQQVSPPTAGMVRADIARRAAARAGTTRRCATCSPTSPCSESSMLTRPALAEAWE